MAQVKSEVHFPLHFVGGEGEKPWKPVGKIISSGAEDICTSPPIRPVRK